MDVPATAHGLAAGTRFGRFAVVRPMAGGGMSEVYLGVDTESDAHPPAPVAIKRLLPHMAWDPEYVRMFLDEVRIAAGLTHPNIVQALDFGLGDGGYYFAMEYLHGMTVHALLKKAARSVAIPREVAVSIVLEVAAGLEYAHQAGLVHRDVSPSNVIVGHDGRVKLVDFGIARMRAETRYTRAGTLKGKVGYMSPEQCRGENVDPRSDVFGLGILLYELTVGRRAFFGDSDYGVINRTVGGEYRRPETLMPSYPPQLSRIVERALAVDRDDRYPSAAALASELTALGFAPAPEATRALMHAMFGAVPLPALDLPAPPPRSKRGLRLTAVLGAAAALGFGGYVAGGGLRSAPQAEAPAAPAPTQRPAASVSPKVDAAPSPAPPPSPEASDATVALAPPPDVVVLEAEDDPVVDIERPRKKRASKRRTRPKSPPPAPEATSSKPAPGNALLPPSWKKE